MGANRSYNIAIGGVPDNSRSHIDTGRKICGHKVVLQKSDPFQSKNIMNSNSESPIYIIGHERKDGSIEIHSINIFEGHYLKIEINLKYDINGNLLLFNGKESNTHSHTWIRAENGDMHRQSFQTHEAIPYGYSGLLDEIVNFNKKKIRKQ